MGDSAKRVSRRRLLLSAGVGGVGGVGLATGIDRTLEPAAPGSPLRSLDPRDYGASGTGEADDSEAIQRALDAAARSGRPVSLPAGTYAIGKPIEIPSSVTLRGAGSNATVLRAAPGTELESLLGHRTQSGTNPPAKGVVVEDLGLVGNARTRRGVLLEGLARSNLSRLRIEGLRHPEAIGLDVTGWDDDGVYRNASDNSFYSVEIANCTTGARLAKAPEDPATFGPSFHNFYSLRISGYTRVGFDLDAGEGVTAVGLRCTSNADGVTHIRLNDDVPTLLAPCTDCTDATGQTGIEITDKCTSALILNPLGDMGKAPSNSRIDDRGRATIVLRRGLPG